MLTESMPYLVRVYRGRQASQCWGALGEFRFLVPGLIHGVSQHLVPCGDGRNEFTSSCSPFYRHLDKDVEGEPRRL